MERFSSSGFDHGGGADDSDPGRHDSRDSLFLTAQMRIVTRDHLLPIRVRNLSPGGMMAETDYSLCDGDMVEVEIRGMGWVPGHVVWIAEGRAGVAFERSVDLQAARKPVVVPTAARVDKPIKPIL